MDSAAQGRTPCLHPKDDTETAVAVLRGPRQCLLWGLTAALCTCGQDGSLATSPPPCQLPVHLWWEPAAPDMAPQRTNPHHRSRDRHDTRKWTWQDRGSPPSCPEQVVCLPTLTADGGRSPFPGEERLVLGGQLQAAPDDVGCPPGLPREALQFPGQIATTHRPCQPWYRDQIIPHRHTDRRLQETREGAGWGGGGGAAATAGRPCWSPRGPALVGEVPSEPSMLHLAPTQVLKVELEDLRFR